MSIVTVTSLVNSTRTIKETQKVTIAVSLDSNIFTPLVVMIFHRYAFA